VKIAQLLSELPEIAWIKDSSLREAVASIWIESFEASSWSSLRDCPKHPADAPHVSLIDHVRSVTQQAAVVAGVARQMYSCDINNDILVAGALLHDVSKLVEYEPDDQGSGARKSRLGELIQHGAYGAFKAWSHNLPIEVIHIVVSHTNQSRHAPNSLESIVVHYVDYCDSDLLLYMTGKPLFAE